MDNYKLTVGVEPIDKYEKAKQDLIAAKQSFDKLSQEQKWHLINEMLGAEAATMFFQVMQKYFG